MYNNVEENEDCKKVMHVYSRKAIRKVSQVSYGSMEDTDMRRSSGVPFKHQLH